LTIMLVNRSFVVLTAFDGNDGLIKAKDEQPDIILLDLIMPKMDGFEMIKRLKSDEATNTIPVIILTARSDTEARFKTHRYRADAYIVKPFHLPDLITKINQLLFPKG
ncbi:MAG: response regulator, partial [Candidatus Poribacteria bacterium]